MRKGRVLIWSRVQSQWYALFEDVSILQFYKRQVSFVCVQLLASQERLCYVEIFLLIFLLILSFYAIYQCNIFLLHTHIH